MHVYKMGIFNTCQCRELGSAKSLEHLGNGNGIITLEKSCCDGGGALSLRPANVVKNTPILINLSSGMSLKMCLKSVLIIAET